MKCFEKLVLQHVEHNIPASLEPHHHAYITNRSTEIAIVTVLLSRDAAAIRAIWSFPGSWLMSLRDYSERP